MEVYIVGGWVRDTLLKNQGYPVEPKDRDWLVLGSSPEEMVRKGFIPVGSDFPVFIHPRTGEEYALARTERKNGRGYYGFTFFASPDITLEDDLQRRDLTINAMAMDRSGELYDYYGGQDDLKNKVLRHISRAFEEDPLRLLRVARFAARFPDFSIAESTQVLLKKIVLSGEVDELVPERVGREFLRALEERQPSRFFEVLKQAGYWDRRYPNWEISESTMVAVDRVDGEDREVKRFALLFADVKSEDELYRLLKTLRVSKEYGEMAQLIVKFHGKVPAMDAAAEKKLDFLVRTDCIRRPERFERLLACLSVLDPTIKAEAWLAAAKRLKEINVPALIASTRDKTRIPQVLEEARLLVIKEISDQFADQ